MLEFLGVFFLVFASVFFGLWWGDRRGERVERDLKQRIAALKLVVQAGRQELLMERQNGWDAVVLEKLLKTLEDYQLKLGLYKPGDRDWYFNRGVRHGLNAAVIFIRGWL